MCKSGLCEIAELHGKLACKVLCGKGISPKVPPMPTFEAKNSRSE